MPYGTPYLGVCRRCKVQPHVDDLLLCEFCRARCVTCALALTPVDGTDRYCLACRRRRGRENARRNGKRWREAGRQKNVPPCQRCGIREKSRIRGARLCDECRWVCSDCGCRLAQQSSETSPSVCADCKNDRARNTYNPVIASEQNAKNYRDHREKRIESQRQRRLIDPVAQRRSTLFSKYGITVEQYDVMFAAQGGNCAACNRPEIEIDKRTGLLRKLSIDHDHACCPGSRSCGQCIRGLLCGKCNRGIGSLGDDLESLRKMIVYLEGSSVPHVAA